MKTVEELLLPRYKVIADWPGCSYEVGTVLNVDPSGELYSPVAGYSRTVTKVMQCDVDEYTANIQPLPWWSDRKVEDMPEYVKCINTPDQRIMPGQVFKVTWCAPVAGRTATGQYIITNTNCFEPATREEYELFKQKEK